MCTRLHGSLYTNVKMCCDDTVWAGSISRAIRISYIYPHGTAVFSDLDSSIYTLMDGLV